MFTHPDHLSTAIKQSKSLESCIDWKKEFEIQKNVAELFNTSFPNSVVHVVEVDQFLYYSGNCYISMERICPLKGDPVHISLLNGSSTHALMGNPRGIEKYPGGRGIGVGRDIISKYINLERAALDLGEFIAYIHFALELDGSDLEYIIGPKCSSGTVKINVLDFGMVDKFSIDKAVDSMIDIPYFPIGGYCEFVKCIPQEAKDESRLAKIFWTSYINTASLYGKKAVAEKIREEVLA